MHFNQVEMEMEIISFCLGLYTYFVVALMGYKVLEWKQSEQKKKI